MSKANSYFELLHRKDGTYIRIHPAIDNGDRLEYEEIKAYLARREIFGISQTIIKGAIMADKVSELKLTPQVISPVDEEAFIVIARNHMKASVRFYPPSKGGQPYTMDKLKSEISKNGIIEGIDLSLVEAFFENRVYGTDFVIAKGRMPVEGTDPYIVYHFKTEMSLKPKLKDDGTVDFHSLDGINNVSEGDVLAEIIPGVEGVEGVDVLGEVLKCKELRKVKFKVGKNVVVSEDEMKLMAQYNGNVALINDAINVATIYEVKSNVDMSTGDIDFKGDVHVKGNIQTGFTVKADGNVTVDGVIEGAVVKVGGNLVVKKGIQGMKRCAISVGGDVAAKFIENAFIMAEGNVNTESIMHSNVNTKGKITVTSKKGFIVGGVIRSAEEIRCKTAGSVMETITELQIGPNLEIEDEIMEIEASMARFQLDREDCLKVIQMYKNKITTSKYYTKEYLELIKELVGKSEFFSQKIQELTLQHEALKRYLILNNDVYGKVVVEGVTNLGVKIVISGVVYHIRRELYNSKFEREKADIIITPLF